MRVLRLRWDQRVAAQWARRSVRASAVLGLATVVACQPLAVPASAPPDEAAVAVAEPTAAPPVVAVVGASGELPSAAAPVGAATIEPSAAAEAAGASAPLASLPAAKPTALPTPRPRATPTPAPTPIPVSAALQPTASGLATKLGIFRAAVRTHDMPTMLRLQRELLVDADQAQSALKGDLSRQADSVRQAIADLRVGVTGDNNGLDHAEAALRSALAGQTVGLISPSAVSTPVADANHSLEQMSERLRTFRQAVRDRNADGALKLQGQLLADLVAAEQLAQSDQSEQGRALRDALADLRKGLDGDGGRLAAATTALGKLAAPAPVAANVDTSRLAASLASKVDAFRTAAAANSRGDLLRLQRAILTEADQDTATLRSDQSAQATALREVLDAVRAGVSGDLGKLDGARAELGKLAGEDVTLTTASVKPIADLSRFAGDLDGKVGSFADAIQKGDASSMLRLQRELTEAADQVDASLKEVQSKPAEEARAAIAAIRTAFAGDLSKLDEARIHLRTISGVRQPATAPRSAANVAPGDLQPVAQELRNKLIAVRDAVQTRQPVEELAKRRETLKAEVAKAEDTLQGTTDPRADRLRAALNAAREAAAGDDAKVEAASRLLEQGQ